jgi:hypothetical protein
MPAPTSILETIDASPRGMESVNANLRAMPRIQPSSQAAPLPPSALTAGTLSHTLRSLYATRFVILNTSRSFFGNGEANYSGTIPNGTVDGEIDLVVVASQIISVILVADHDVTIKTNSATTPQETINLLLNVPIWWNSEDNGPDVFPYAGNITKFYVTNGSGSDVHLQLAHLLDLRA